MYLGIDQFSEMVYQGRVTHGYVVWPLPLLTPAKFVSATASQILPGNFDSSDLPEYLFREDTFDPVTRIRRGRFYKRSPSQPQQWVLMADPTMGANYPGKKADTYTFQSCTPSDIVSSSVAEQQLVIMGTSDAFGLWTVVNKELIYTKEVVVTLKARRSLGVLPDIDWTSVPGDTALLKDKIECLLDDAYRAGAESVVDRAREAATAILSLYLQGVGVVDANGKDLGTLTDLLDKQNGKNGQRIVRCAAEIPQRLHSRSKHAEQEKRDYLRPIRAQDAELAVQCIGVMLCDLGWAVW